MFHLGRGGRIGEAAAAASVANDYDCDYGERFAPSHKQAEQRQQQAGQNVCPLGQKIPTRRRTGSKMEAENGVELMSDCANKMRQQMGWTAAAEAERAALRELNYAVNSWRKATGGATSATQPARRTGGKRTREKSCHREETSSRERTREGLMCEKSRWPQTSVARQSGRPARMDEHSVAASGVGARLGPARGRDEPHETVVEIGLAEMGQQESHSHQCNESSSSGFSSANESTNASMPQESPQEMGAPTSVKIRRGSSSVHLGGQMDTQSRQETSQRQQTHKFQEIPASHQPEFAYSTLCRDEFSSFIAMEQPVWSKGPRRDCPPVQKSKSVGELSLGQPESQQLPLGPMLVGVHECETPPPVEEAILGLESRNGNSPATYTTVGSSEHNGHISDEEDELNYHPQAHLPLVLPTASSSGLCSSRGESSGSSCYSRAASPTSSRPSTEADQDDKCQIQVEEYFSHEDEEEEDEQGPHSEGKVKMEEGEQNYSCLDSLEDSNGRPLEKEVIYEEIGDRQELKCADIAPKNDRNFTLTLDLYLKRVECLLRLAKGDKTVSMSDAFGNHFGPSNGNFDENGLIEVDENLKTSIGYADCEQNVTRKPLRVIQEFEVELSSDEESLGSDGDASKSDCDQNQRRTRLTKVIRDNFKSLEKKLLEGEDAQRRTPQKEEKAQSLNWWPTTLNDHPPLIGDRVSREIGETSVEKLCQMMVSKWLKSEGDNSIKRHNDLVNRVYHHMEEFLNDFRRFNEDSRLEACLNNLNESETWNSNWLFAAQDEQKVESKSQKIDRKCKSFVELRNLRTISRKKRDLEEFLKGCRSDLLQSMTSNDEQRCIDSLYEAQGDEDRASCRAGREQKPVDVCQLLLNDRFDELNESQELENACGKRRKKSLNISYASSLLKSFGPSRNFSFLAFGYLFETDKVSEKSLQSARQRRKLEQLRQNIIKRLIQQLNSDVARPISKKQNEQDCVKFLVNISSVEVSQKWPIVQFCAKISGALPIKVSWYKIITDNDSEKVREEDLVSDLKHKTRVNLKQTDQDEGYLLEQWPLTASGSFDFEYKNARSSSWYRFRRKQEELIFEIRQPDTTNDFNKTYKCLIENYCSREECEFELRLKEEPEGRVDGGRTKTVERLDKQAGHKSGSSDKTKKSPVEQEQQQANGCAIMRTWSQRTLNRPATMAANSKQQNQWTNVGNNDTFGTDFAYHPDNLLKRLEANKYSLTLRARLSRGSLRSGGQFISDSQGAFASISSLDGNGCPFASGQPPDSNSGHLEPAGDELMKSSSVKSEQLTAALSEQEKEPRERNGTGMEFSRLSDFMELQQVAGNDVRIWQESGQPKAVHEKAETQSKQRDTGTNISVEKGQSGLSLAATSLDQTGKPLGQAESRTTEVRPVPTARPRLPQSSCMTSSRLSCIGEREAEQVPPSKEEIDQNFSNDDRDPPAQGISLAKPCQLTGGLLEPQRNANCFNVGTKLEPADWNANKSNANRLQLPDSVDACNREPRQQSASDQSPPSELLKIQTKPKVAPKISTKNLPTVTQQQQQQQQEQQAPPGHHDQSNISNAIGRPTVDGEQRRAAACGGSYGPRPAEQLERPIRGSVKSLISRFSH